MHQSAPRLRPEQAVAVQPVAPAFANPVFIPIADNQCAWEQVVAVVSDYFRIEREEPVHVAGTEGRITTVAEVSPTIFEPWRQDTGDPPQRMENTLQTMRRRAVVRVVPAKAANGSNSPCSRSWRTRSIPNTPRPARLRSVTTARSPALSIRSAGSRSTRAGSPKVATRRWSST